MLGATFTGGSGAGRTGCMLGLLNSLTYGMRVGADATNAVMLGAATSTSPVLELSLSITS